MEIAWIVLDLSTNVGIRIVGDDYLSSLKKGICALNGLEGTDPRDELRLILHDDWTHSALLVMHHNGDKIPLAVCVVCYMEGEDVPFRQWP